MEEQKETIGSNNPPEEHETNAQIEGSFASSRQGAYHDQQQTVASANKRYNGPTKQESIYHPLHIWRFLVEPRHSNAVVAIFTILLFVSTVSYTVFAALQWHAMKDTLLEMKVQNIAQERAVLTIEDAALLLKDGDLGIRIRNKGRTSATVRNYKIRYRQIVSERIGITFQREQDSNPNRIVSIEDPYVISAKLPPIPKEAWDISLAVLIEYEDGFGGVQTVSSCFSPSSETDNWRANCMWVDSVDLSKKLPNDIVLPEASKKN